MRKVVIAAVSFAVLLGTAAQPWTAVSQEARPAAPGDSFLTIPPCAFNEVQNNYDYVRSNRLYMSSGSGEFRATIYLPQGSTIKKIVLICIDNNISGSVDLYL